MPDLFDRMLRQESGNRQHDSSGKVIRSNKGAVGAAQVMPSTGPEAARLAGLQWDPVRFESDGNYNKALGKAFHDSNLKRFGGDERLATAAYTAGPTRVARLKKQYGSQWEAHLPRETIDYLDKVMGNLTPEANLPASVASNQPSQAGATGPASNPFDPFAASPRVTAADANVQAEGARVQDILSAATVELDSLQEERQQGLQQAVNEKSAVLSDIEAQTTEMQERIKPIFAKRAALAHRQTELAEMSPLKRSILGIFNRNYDPERLAEIDKGLEGEAQAIGQEYQVTNQMQNTLLGVIEGKYAGTNALTTLAIENTNQDIDIATKGWGIARQMFADSLAGVSAGVEITRAQVQAKDKVLTEAAPGVLNTALAQARRGDGTAMINGVPITIGELETRTKQLQSQELAIEGQRLGLQNQKENLRRQHENDLITHMSATEIQQAVAAGGTFRGVRLDQGQLTQALQGHLQRNSLLAGQAVSEVDRQTYTQTVDVYNARTQDTIRRIQGVTGAMVPEQYKAYLGNMVSASRQFAATLARAPEAAKPQLRAQFLQQISGFMKEQDKVIDRVVQGMTRNPDAQIVIGAWMKGNTLTSEQSTRGLIALASGGSMPPGMKLGGPAAIAIKAAQGAIQGVYGKYGGEQSVQSMLKGQGAKGSKEQIQRELQTAVNQAVSGAWVNGNMRQMIGAIPQMASAAGHKAGMISPEDFRAAQSQGDATGLSQLGTKLGWNEDQVRSVFGPNGTKEAGFKKLTGGDESKGSYKQLREQLTTLQSAGFLRALDQSPSGGRMDVRPSSALVDFMRSDKFQQDVGFFNRNVGHSGFGESMVDSITGGSLGETMYKYANSLGQIQGTVVADDQLTTRKQATQYRGTPLKRAGVILGAIPGLNAQDERILLGGIQRTIAAGEGGVPMTAGGEAGWKSAGTEVSSKIDSLILHGRFEDPKLEKLRKTAAQHWQAYSESTDSAMSRFFDAIWEN